MILKNGITGFHSSNKIHELPQVKFEDFKKNMFRVMSSIGYKPIAFKPAGVTPNFHIGHFEKGKDRICIVCNTIYPFVTVVLEPKESICELTYVEIPTIETVITQYTEYSVLRKLLRNFNCKRGSGYFERCGIVTS